MRRVGVLLAGCGVYDGTDVQETVLLVVALSRRRLRVAFLAPDASQREVVDHSTGETVPAAPERNLLLEAARIARGRVVSASVEESRSLDALVVPGGRGVVRNLCGEGPGPLGGGPPRPEIARMLDALASRDAPVAGIGLGRVPLARHRNLPLEGELLAMAPATAVEAGGILYTPGFLGTDSIVEVERGIESLVALLAEKLGVHEALSTDGERR